ncbi:MAG: GNAT family N-acetyltransferase [Burkholderiales bacterium]|nr:GNAT family N-acetyltransferase [Burkholderiales bacterium]
MAERAKAGPITSVKLRRLAAQDLDAVVDIDAQITGRSRRAYFERRLQAALDAPALHTQFASEEKGVLKGYVLARRLEGEFGSVAPVLRLEVIGVRPGEQGHGYGDSLLGALEADARKNGVFELRTQAGWKDHAMLGFLDHAGFMLGGNQVIDCAIHAGRISSGDSEKVLAPEAGNQGAEIDHSMPQANDFEALARDRAEVRSLTRADLDDIVRIDRRIVGRDRAAYITRIVDEVLNNSAIRVSLVARQDESATGYIMASVDFGDFGRTEPVAVIDTIGVDPGFTGAGIGSALLSQLFVNLEALRVERVATVVERDNFGLLQFFYRAGFGFSQRLSFLKRLA